MCFVLPAWIRITAFGWLMLAVSPSQALSQGLILVVDMQRAMVESVSGKAAQNNIEADLKRRQLKMNGAQAEISRLQGELEKQSGVLSADALDQKRELLRKRQVDISRQIQDEREAADKVRGSEIRKVVGEIDKVVKQIAEKRGAAFVLEREPGFVIYADDRIDVTAEVISNLDASKLGL